jgi:hypothetical protein
MEFRLLVSTLSICIIGFGCGSNGSGPGGSSGFGPGAAPIGAPVQLSSDPFKDTTGQHQTAVEPSIFANGATMVSAFQVGRINAGASDAVGFATSTNGGGSWTRGFLPSLTTAEGGTYQNATDAVVTFDALHSMWMVESLVFTSSTSTLVVSRSPDGLSWSAPVTVASGANLDKCWIACDNQATSPYRGTCYAEWDDVGNGQTIEMSRSTDGGVTWGAASATADSATGLGGQIAIQPSGKVVVPFFNGSTSSREILSFSSTDGGTTWSSSALVSATEPAAIPVRGETDPQTVVDSSGKIYVVWFDCRFESSCTSNDIVMTTSTDGTIWSSVARLATQSVGSGINIFLPTIAVDPANSNHLVLMAYTSNTAQCSGTSCTIQPVQSISTDGGANWSSPAPLWPAFPISEVATTSEGSMVGDYFSIAFEGSTAFSTFSAAATPVPSGATYNQQIFVTAD